jgi:hypothetical protein
MEGEGENLLQKSWELGHEEFTLIALLPYGELSFNDALGINRQLALVHYQQLFNDRLTQLLRRATLEEIQTIMTTSSTLRHWYPPSITLLYQTFAALQATKKTTNNRDVTNVSVAPFYRKVTWITGVTLAGMAILGGGVVFWYRR